MLPRLLSGVLLALATSQAVALTCEELSKSVSTKIKAAGVESFAVTIVDSDARAEGKVVGTCAHGSKKLIYEKHSPEGESFVPSAAPPKAAQQPPRSKEPILTECKDGSVSIGGNCKK